MIKCILKNNIFIYCLLTIFILGYISGNQMTNSFENYLATFYHRPIFYSLIIVNIFVDYVLFKNYFHSSFIFRFKDILNLLKQHMKIELLFCMIIFILFHIGIGIHHFSLMTQNIIIILKLFINYIIITMIIVNIIKLIDIKINNRIVSTMILLCFIACTDIGLEIYELISGKTLRFLIQFIYVIPCVYKMNIFIDLCLLIFTIFLTILSAYFMNKKDYRIKGIAYEEN